MTESLFLINPRSKKKLRKGRNPARLARYWASRRGGKRKRRKARAVMANPPRRRVATKSTRRVSRRRARNPIFRSHRRRARNPVFRRNRRARARNPFSIGGLKSALVPAAIGAGGALAMSVAYGYIAPKLPASLQTGYMPALVKAAAAIGIGMLAKRFMGRADGQAVMLGGLTVVLVGVITPLVTQAVPTLPGLSGLQGYGDYIPYSRGMGAYMKRPGLGFYSPAAVIGAKKSNQMGAYMARSVPGMADLSGSGYTGMDDGM